MTEMINIRESIAGDRASIETLYPQAFPDEDLVPLVRQLLAEKAGVLSLVAMAGDTLAGHMVFTACGIDGKPDRVALLGPLAVVPDQQRKGIGGALIKDGLALLIKADTSRVFVLGDPAYYGRYGFTPDDGVEPPYPLPEDWAGAWQSLGLQGDAPQNSGKLTVPPPWQERALWSP